MTTDTLSDKIIESDPNLLLKVDILKAKDVKDFIKNILRDLDFLDNPNWHKACARIEKRAGQKLVDGE